jgi:hypothetical protein
MGIHHSDQAMGTLGGTVIAFIGIVDGSDITQDRYPGMCGSDGEFWGVEGIASVVATGKA